MSGQQMSKVALMPGPGQAVQIGRRPVPQLEPGAVLLKTIASEVCGTDVHLQHGLLSGVRYPLIPGHISVGSVAEIAGEVAGLDGAPLKIGDVVTFCDVHGTCGHCWYCLVAKASTRCPHRKVYGITYGADDEPGLLGGWSEYIYLKPGVQILRLAAGVSPEAWIGGGCGLPTATHAIELARIQLADKVLVQGSGPVGLSAAALARLSGASWVGVIGAPADRLEQAKRMGADWVADVTGTSLEERAALVRDATGGRGPDIVIEASGNPAAVLEGCDLVRDAGRYIVVGQYTDNGTVEFNPHLQLNRKHLEMRGCWGIDFSHLYRAMEVLARFNSQVGWQNIISRRYSLEEAGQALADVEARRVVKAVILPNGDAAM